MDYSITCDGGSLGNGTEGAIAYGSYMIQVQDKTYGPYRLEFGEGTNNEAEYKALIAALRHIVAYYPAGSKYKVVINTDSELVMRQVTGVYQVKAKHLRPLYDRVMALIAQIDEDCVSFEYIPESLMKTILGH